MTRPPPRPPLFPTPPLSRSRRGQTKLSYGYGSGASLSFTALVLDVHQRVFPATNIADPALYGGASGTSRIGVLNRSEEHTSELQSRLHLVCRLLLEKKKKKR